MAHRLSYRPGFALRRFWRHRLEDLRVWRLNRQVADAFRDPLLEGRGPLGAAAAAIKALFPGSNSFRSPSRMLRLAAAPVVLGLLGSFLAYRTLQGTVPESEAELAGIPSAPVSDGVLLPYVKPLPAPPAPAAPEASASLALPPAGDTSSEGVNMAIMLAAAGLDAAPEEVEPVPERMPDRYHALIASKKDRTLYVYSREGQGRWKEAARYPMAYGRGSGDKSDAGDRRTPEGRYWLTGTVSGPSQGPLYGPLVFPLNYPSARDIAEGKGGEGIWIHGVEAGKSPNYTRGCVSLANEDVMALAQYAGLGTPIVVLPDTESPNPAKQLDETGMQREYPALVAEYGGRPGSAAEKRQRALADGKAFLAKEAKDFPPASRMSVVGADREAILARLDKWKGDWSRRDTSAYEANYGAGFKDRMGRSRDEFMERKRRIFASKRRITMELQEPEIKVEGYGRVSVTFRQEYEAEGAAPGEGVQKSSGPKTVWLEQGADGWFIVME
jgi:lipoprotein-anchoring transpeptidase ErfK/SrfK